MRCRRRDYYDEGNIRSAPRWVDELGIRAGFPSSYRENKGPNFSLSLTRSVASRIFVGLALVSNAGPLTFPRNLLTNASFLQHLTTYARSHTYRRDISLCINISIYIRGAGCSTEGAHRCIYLSEGASFARWVERKTLASSTRRIE